MVDLGNRGALESLYHDQMWFKRYEEYKENGITRHRLMAPQGPYPCRVSFSYGLSPGEMTDSFTKLSGQAKLFCAPELDIPEGSVIRVVRNDKKTLFFEASGPAAWYASHQEIPIRNVKREA